MSLWYGIAALVSSVLMIYYFAVYVYPHPVVGPGQTWAEGLGWTIGVSPVALALIVGAVHAVYTQKCSLRQRLIQSLKSESFSPGDDSHEYTSAENTGDTVVHNPSVSQQPIQEKTETEVFVQPVEDADDPVHV